MIYLNNAATSSPKPACVLRAVNDAMNAIPAAAHRGGFEETDVFEACRESMLTFIGAQNGKLAFCKNATEAINLAIRGIGLKRGDIVLAEAAAHNSVLRALRELERTVGIRAVILPIDKCARIDQSAFRAAAEYYEPKLAVITHAGNVTGAVNDVRALCTAAKEYGAITLVDAAQSIGIYPVNVEIIGCDMLAFTSHKYLLAPQGGGGLYFREEINLAPLIYGGTGSNSEQRYMPPELPEALEAGTPNELAVAGLYAALCWQRDNPPDYALLNAKLVRLEAGLNRAGANVLEITGARTPIISFNLPGIDCTDAAEILLRKYGIILRSGLHCAPLAHRYIGTPRGTLRASLSRFTTDAELDALSTAAASICASR